MRQSLDYPAEDAAAILRLARNDVGLSTRELAERAGVDETVVVEIESRDSHSPGQAGLDVLSTLLIAAEIRPAVPLGYYSAKLRDLAGELGIETVKVFGSIVHGLDTPASDVDFLISLGEGTSGFALAEFQMEAERILRFPVDVMLASTDSPVGACPC